MSRSKLDGTRRIVTFATQPPAGSLLSQPLFYHLQILRIELKTVDKRVK